MTYKELRKRVKDIMTNAKFEHCKDISITNTGKWCINQMIFPISSITGKKLPKPMMMDEHIKFIYKGRDVREEYDTVLIHVEIVDYDGMLVVPSVQIQLTAGEDGELKCTYTEGSGGRSSIVSSIRLVVHERTRELLKDIYDEVINDNGRSTH
jgi:hypothetical protein